MTIERKTTDLNEPKTNPSAELPEFPGAAAQRASILVYHRQGAEVVRLVPGRPVTIGRSGSNDIVVHEPSLSRRHARFTLEEETLWVEDLGSRNGTRINGDRVDRAPVQLGDEVTLGPLSVSLHLMKPSESEVRGLEANDRFCRMLKEEVTRSQILGHKFALLLVGTAPGHEGVLCAWGLGIRQLVRPVDRVGLYAQGVVEILLAETDLEEATRVAETIVRRREPDQPSLLCGVAVFPDAGRSTEELIEASRTALQRADIDHPIQAARFPSFNVDPAETPSSPVVASPAMVELYRTIEQLSTSSIPVLILGETGTGKEVISRAIHQRSKRSKKPMLCVNCGAIPEPLIESTLFGHERGAFTGADSRTTGVFEEANGGTVLLDEIGELSAHAQVSLLRVLDLQRISRVGSHREIEVDVRVIAATHRDLAELCRAGQFRDDLYYRLSAMPLMVPPLRERGEEIRPLAEQFIRSASRINRCPVKTITDEAFDLLYQHQWPGNVRELRNVIERAVVIARGDLITSEDLPDHLVRAPVVLSRLSEMSRPTFPTGEYETSRARPAEEITSVTDLNELESPAAQTLRKDGAVFNRKLQLFEICLIQDALRRTGANQTRAAQLLEMPRRTLINKMDFHGIRLDGACASIPTPAVVEPEVDALIKMDLDFKAKLKRYEADLLQQALRRCDDDPAQAALSLGLPRYTFEKKVRRLK
jgi:DNA-binding NtrC family response regulator